MENIILSPSKYIQGIDVIEKLAVYAKKDAFVIASNSGMRLTKPTIADNFAKENLKVKLELFQGECSKAEVERLKQKVTTEKVIIGIGGGKALDTAKALAYYLELPVIIVPTVASSDAPCSALSVLYTEDGIFEEYLVLPTNPSAVIMDTNIISKAPARLLVAGMGDALATYFEARATVNSGSTNISGGLPTNGALALARLCYDTLLSKGKTALASANAKVSTKALEDVVEANTYLSGVGFESGGLAAAHAIHNGLTVLEDCHNLYHGEKVAFGTLVQLVLENAPTEEFEEVLNFCKSVGLPTNLEQMGVKEIDEAKILEVATMACAEGETIYNMPFEVTPEKVKAAILAANILGK